MAKPDVRVRLSAEGVAEVVGALKKVQAQGQKVTAAGAKGFGGFNRVLGSTSNLLGGLGIALGVRQFTRFIGNAIEAGDQLNKLSLKTGASVENLSALSLVARLADSSLEQVGNALAKMNKFVGDAAAGIPTALAALEDLGLGVDDFRGKDSVEMFEMVSKSVIALGDNFRRRRTAMILFGRSGANLIPTMKALADEGLLAVINRAKELGVLIDHDLAAASEKIKDDVEILKMQSEAIGVRFVSGFGPAMSQTLQVLSGDLAQTTTAWEDFGTAIGQTIKWVVGVVSTGFDIIGTYIGGVHTILVSAGKGLVSLIKGDMEGVRREAERFNRWYDQETADLADRIAGRFELLTKPPPAPTGTEEGGAAALGGATPEELAELADRRAKALQTTLDRELALAKKYAALKTKAEKREFEAGLQDVQTYYSDRREIAVASYAEELRVLEEKERLIAAIVDPGRVLQEEEKVRQERERAELEHANEMAELTAEERDAVRELSLERIELEQQLLEMQGKRIEAERLGFEEQLRLADLTLRQAGVSDAEREATLARLRAALDAGVDFATAKQEADAILGEYQAARAEIEAQASAGLLSQLDAEEQILELERERIETLRELAAALEEAAFATGDPEKIEAAKAFAASIREIGYSIEASSNAFEQFRSTILESATAALTDFLDTGIDGSKNLKDAFRDMASSMIASLKRLVAEMLAAAVIKKIFGFFGGGGEVGGGGGVNPETAVPPGGARGGWIRGPGTGTSDSILAMLSDEEFVVRATVTRQAGVLDHLRELNRFGARALSSRPRVLNVRPARFAEGGLVDGRGGAGGEVLNGQLAIGLEDGLVLREFETPQGQRILVRSVSANRRAIRSALGL